MKKNTILSSKDVLRACVSAFIFASTLQLSFAMLNYFSPINDGEFIFWGLLIYTPIEVISWPWIKLWAPILNSINWIPDEVDHFIRIFPPLLLNVLIASIEFKNILMISIVYFIVCIVASALMILVL